MESTHFQLDLVILDNRDPNLEQIYFPLQQKIIPNPKQELLIIIETIIKNGKKPTDKKHPSL